MEDQGQIARAAAPDTGAFESFVRLVEQQEAAPRASRAASHLSARQAKIAGEMMLAQMRTGLSLAEIAARFDMSVSHFTRAFRRAEGISPYQWYMRRRIARSMTLLCDERIPIAAIAGACGFVDQSHFTKAFTRRMGVTPGRWRRSLRGPERVFGDSRAPGDDLLAENAAPMPAR